MFGVRILLFIVAFIVIIGETWAGVVTIRPVQQAFVIGMGGFVIALLVSVSMFALSGQQSVDGKETLGNPIQWLSVLLAGFMISAVSFYLPSEILPALADVSFCRIDEAGACVVQ